MIRHPRKWVVKVLSGGFEPWSPGGQSDSKMLDENDIYLMPARIFLIFSQKVLATRGDLLGYPPRSNSYRLFGRHSTEQTVTVN